VKIRLIYSYNGAKFGGSQTQPDKKSVEDALNLALSHVGIFEGVISSSRTDKGVHAKRQVSTTHCLDFWDLDELKRRANRHARPHINILKIERVEDDFQVRFSARARSYIYVINHAKFSPFLGEFCHFYPEFETAKFNEILKIFEGKNDFTNFMKLGSGTKSPVREIYRAKARKFGRCTFIYFKANGFLRSQVRLMVANALKSLESGENLSLSRPLTRIPAPPNGLYLSKVFY